MDEQAPRRSGGTGGALDDLAEGGSYGLVVDTQPLEGGGVRGAGCVCAVYNRGRWRFIPTQGDEAPGNDTGSYQRPAPKWSRASALPLTFLVPW